MSFEVGIVDGFVAHHHLVGDFGPSSEPHEHTYRVEANVRCAALLPDGTAFDITRLQDALRAALDGLNGRDLNAIGPLAQPNPTAEVVAHYLYEEIAPKLPTSSVQELRVQVWESDAAYAAFTGHLAASRR